MISMQFRSSVMMRAINKKTLAANRRQTETLGNYSKNAHMRVGATVIQKNWPVCITQTELPGLEFGESVLECLPFDYSANGIENLP